VLRAWCPFHGSDRQCSLRVTLASGRFVCFACGAWGSLAEARERWREERQRQAAFQRPTARGQRAPRPRPAAAAVNPPAPRPPAPREPAPARPDLAQQLATFQAALPDSRGAAYLRQRGIPLALAQQAGVGAAAPGRWPRGACWRAGRAGVRGRAGSGVGRHPAARPAPTAPARRGGRQQARAAGHGQDGSLRTGSLRCWGCRGGLIQTARAACAAGAAGGGQAGDWGA